MDYFDYKENELYCEDIKVLDIAKKVETPFYLYSYKTMKEHFEKLKNLETQIKEDKIIDKKESKKFYKKPFKKKPYFKKKFVKKIATT